MPISAVSNCSNLARAMRSISGYSSIDLLLRCANEQDVRDPLRQEWRTVRVRYAADGQLWTRLGNWAFTFVLAFTQESVR